MSKWIFCEERLPANDVPVLISIWNPKSKMNSTYIATRINQQWIDNDNQVINKMENIVNYWMPLPDDPDKELMINENHEILNKAWETTLEQIKTVVLEYMDMDDIKFEIYKGISDGVKEYFQEYSEDEISKLVTKAFENKLEKSDFSLKFNKL